MLSNTNTNLPTVSPGGFFKVNERCYSSICLQLFKGAYIYLQFLRKI